MITGGVDALSWPARIAFAPWVLALRAERGAFRSSRELGRRVAESNGGEAHARSVLRWPARRACLAFLVLWLFAGFAKVFGRRADTVGGERAVTRGRVRESVPRGGGNGRSRGGKDWQSVPGVGSCVERQEAKVNDEIPCETAVGADSRELSE